MQHNYMLSFTPQFAAIVDEEVTRQLLKEHFVESMIPKGVLLYHVKNIDPVAQLLRKVEELLETSSPLQVIFLFMKCHPLVHLGSDHFTYHPDIFVILFSI